MLTYFLLFGAIYVILKMSFSRGKYSIVALQRKLVTFFE